MKFYRYWVKEELDLDLDGSRQPSAVHGHSNASLEDARLNALRNARSIEKRINQGESRSREYEAAIREEIVETIDEKNLISRNRYGALVLNSEDTVFVDIDEPRYGFWRWLFARKRDKKTDIVAMVEERIQKSRDYQRLGFRIYETHAGIRLIVLGRALPPRSAAVAKLMKDFGADRLYALLCKKQDCYRARLTPKPYRMRLKAFRVSHPRTPTEDAALTTWLSGYEEKSARYAVCRFIKQVGSGPKTRIVELHDERTRAGEALRLV